MTVKNGGRYLREAVDSIRAQDMTDWEAVIVDDGSADDTPAYLERLPSEDSRFRVKLTSGVGRGTALNIAVSMCRADILTNLDADDLAHPQRARVLVEVMGQYPEFVVITGRSQLATNYSVPEWISGRQVVADVADVTPRLAHANPVGHSSVGIRRSAMEVVDGYDEKRSSQFDYDLWVRLALEGYRLGGIDATLGAKRSHKGQSYERSAHLRYASRSALVQWRAVRGLGVNRFFGAIRIGARIVWACVPVKGRMWARRQGFLK